MCWHKWEKWAVVEHGKTQAVRTPEGLTLEPGMRYDNGSYELQRRQCLKCGKSQLRETRS